MHHNVPKFSWHINSNPRHSIKLVYLPTFIHVVPRGTQLWQLMSDQTLGKFAYELTRFGSYLHPRKLTCSLKRDYFSWNTSSNHRFSGDMLVFREVPPKLPKRMALVSVDGFPQAWPVKATFHSDPALVIASWFWWFQGIQVSLSIPIPSMGMVYFPALRILDPPIEGFEPV